MSLQLTTMSNDLTITIPLRKCDFDLATKLSQKHESVQKQQQVYLNTLARCAINSYCQYLNLETNFNELLSVKNSQDYFTYYFMDSADLTLKDWGKVECRAILPNSEICYIPPEVFEERIGYFLIEIDEENWSATILDFLPQVTESEIKITELEKNPEIFFDLLNLLEVLKKVEQQILEDQSLVNLPTFVNSSLKKIRIFYNSLTQELNQILTDLPNSLVNAIDSLVTQKLAYILTGETQYSFATAKAISNTKSVQSTEISPIPLVKTIYLGEQELVLNLSQKVVENEVFDISVRLYPSNDYIYLPDGVKFAILDENSQSIPELDLEKEANANNWLQLNFSAEIDDQFIISVSLNDDNFAEKFII